MSALVCVCGGGGGGGGGVLPVRPQQTESPRRVASQGESISYSKHQIMRHIITTQLNNQR